MRHSVKTATYIVVAVFLSFLLLAAPASHACRGPQSETRTFLTSLPEGADAKPHVGQVEILSINQNKASPDFTTHVTAKVVKPFAGLETGQIITIIADLLSSCARDHDIKTGEHYYIAGEIGKDGLFRGEWKGLPFTLPW